MMSRTIAAGRKLPGGFHPGQPVVARLYLEPVAFQVEGE